MKLNPPQPFDVARALRVFSSKVQYVEIQVENYRISSRQVQLPEVLLNISDDRLRDQISSRLRAPAEALGPVEIVAETKNGDQQVEANEKWVSRQRKLIEDAYTYIVPRYGRVIFSRDRDAFRDEIERFERNLGKYCQAATTAFEAIAADFKDRLVAEYLPKWQQSPPRNFARHGVEATEENLRHELSDILERTVREAISFEAPQVRVVYKNIAPESVNDPDFREPLRNMMRRRHVPIAVIDSLFAIGDAAPAIAR